MKVCYLTWFLIPNIVYILLVLFQHVNNEMTYFLGLLISILGWFLFIFWSYGLIDIIYSIYFHFIKLHKLKYSLTDIASEVCFHMLLKILSWDFFTGFQVPIFRWWAFLNSIVKWCETPRLPYQIMKLYHEKSGRTLKLCHTSFE